MKFLYIKKDPATKEYWIHDKDKGILDCEIGPYNNRKEADDDRAGLTRTILENKDIWPLDNLVSKKR